MEMWLQSRLNGVAVASIMAAAFFTIVRPGLAANCGSGSTVLSPANIKPAAVLSQLDFNQNGVPDASPDSDGDGLPDTWEENVSIFAPTAIGPGTPSTFLISRLLVLTDPCKDDTDEDGLTDFVEVFGLKFVEDNGNGKLDFLFDDEFFCASEPSKCLNGRWDVGEPIDGRSEWLDLNNDGMPSIGELPIENLYGAENLNGTAGPVVFWVDDVNGDTLPDTVHFDESRLPPRRVSSVLASTAVVGHPGLELPTRVSLNDGSVVDLIVRVHDYDGFIFTDPKSRDTDGDGDFDTADLDPLINPATFGIPATGGKVECTRSQPDGTRVAGDLDLDGLGNCSDFGNDLGDSTGALIDNPIEIAELVDLFRKDRSQKSTLPESLVEDMVGADWNGDGLFRITDVRQFTRPDRGSGCFQASLPSDLEAERTNVVAFNQLFTVGPDGLHKLYGEFPQSGCGLPDDPTKAVTAALGNQLGLGPDDAGVPTNYAVQRQGLGLQTILLSFARSIPRPAAFPDVRVWAVLYAWRVPGFDVDGDGFMGSPENDFRVDDRHRFLTANVTGNPVLDGRIEAPQCGAGAAGATAVALLSCTGLWLVAVTRRRRSP